MLISSLVFASLGIHIFGLNQVSGQAFGPSLRKVKPPTKACCNELRSNWHYLYLHLTYSQSHSSKYLCIYLFHSRYRKAYNPVMAADLIARNFAPSVCSKTPYSYYTPLRSYAPAQTFCSVYLAKSTAPPCRSNCKGDALFSILSSLSKSDKNFISTEWYVCRTLKVGTRLTVTS